MYDNKHVSKQIPWIDEFQNKMNIQLSLVNIMPFRYRVPCYTGYQGSIRGCGFEPGHKNDMFCLPGVVFFSRKVSFVVRPNKRMGSNAINNLEGP